MTGNQHQSQSGPGVLQGTERRQGRRFLGLLGAAGEEHQVLRREPGQASQTLGGGVVAVGLGPVVFHRARHSDRPGPGAQATESLGVGLVLHGDQVDLPEQPGHQRPDAQVAVEAVVAQPPVHHRHPGPCFPGRANQVRPKLGLGQEEQVGPDPPHRRTHGPTEIQWAVEDQVARVLLLGQGHAGHGRGRNDALPIRPAPGHRRQQRREQVHLADAHRVKPHARPLRLPPRHAAEKLGRESFPVLPLANRLPEEPGKGQKNHQYVDQVDQIRHHRSPFRQHERTNVMTDGDLLAASMPTLGCAE